MEEACVYIQMLDLGGSVGNVSESERHGAFFTTFLMMSLLYLKESWNSKQTSNEQKQKSHERKHVGYTQTS